MFIVLLFFPSVSACNKIWGFGGNQFVLLFKDKGLLSLVNMVLSFFLWNKMAGTG